MKSFKRLLPWSMTMTCLVIILILSNLNRNIRELNRLQTYPWDFATFDGSGKQVEMFDLQLSPINSNRFYPEGKLGIGEATIERIYRAKSIPHKFTIKWKYADEAETRTQTLNFPQVSKGSVGMYSVELNQDGMWTIEFDSNVRRVTERVTEWQARQEVLRITSEYGSGH